MGNIAKAILGFGVQGGYSLKTILGLSNENHVEAMNKNELNTFFVRQTQPVWFLTYPEMRGQRELTIVAVCTFAYTSG